jgi:hypothetical protein
MGKTKTTDAFRWKGEQNAMANFLNRSFTSGAIAIGGTTTKVKTAATVTYCLDGVFYSKVATDDFATLSGSTQAISTFCKYLLSIDADGDCTATQGTAASSAATAMLPDCPASTTPFGYIQVATDATHTFVPGTTALGAAGITTTYVNLSCMPDSL